MPAGETHRKEPELATQERDPRADELMTVFIPELSEEDNQAEIEKIEALITGGGGTMKETLIASPWGRRRLAYTIRFNGVDYRDGFYTVFHFDMRPSALTDVEREMKLDTNLMRYLLVHDDPKVEFKLYEGLNHLGIKVEGDDDLAAYSVPGHVDAQLIADVAAWMGAH